MSEAETSSNDQIDIVAEAEKAIGLLGDVKSEIGKAVFGQDRVIELVLTAILAGGHALLEGAPGLAKTRLIESTAHALGMDWGRIQFTPDLMPSDILGAEVMDETASGQRSFRFIKGPVFTRLLMADEINRASPRTQSALLQAMQEHHVTVAGAHYDLPRPFHVLATQNPLEQEGTYPLPEAQLDRFLLKIDVTYPDLDTERDILVRTTTGDEATISSILDADKLAHIQKLVRAMPVGEKVVSAILNLVRSARPEQSSDPRVQSRVRWGPSPRAGQALMLSTRARALLRGRTAPSIDDVEALAGPALSHRMELATRRLDEDITRDALITDLARSAV